MRVGLPGPVIRALNLVDEGMCSLEGLVLVVLALGS